MSQASVAASVLDYDTIFGAAARVRAPERLRWARDGEILSYLLDDENRDQDLWILERGDSEPRVLLRHGELDNEDGERIALTSYQWSPDGEQLLLPTKGDLYLYSLSDQSLRRLTSSDEEDEDPKLSPDGRLVAFVRSANLWLVDLESGDERQLTTDGEPDELIYGKTDWLYWEEFWGRNSTGFWWSPDSRRLALYRFDESKVPRYPLLDSTGLDPEVTEQPYPRAGERNPTVGVGILELASGRLVWAQTDADEESYLPRVTWAHDGSQLMIHRLNRKQNALDLLRCDATTGDCQVFVSERSPTWIDIADDFHLLADGRLVWGSDRDGWRRLYLYDERGELVRKLTPDEVAVTSIERVDEERGVIVWSGFRIEELGAKNRQVYRLSIADGSNEALTPTEDWYQARVSPSSERWVRTRSTVNEARQTTVVDREVEIELPSHSEIDRQALPRWRFLTIPGPQGAHLPARMLTPTSVQEGGQHPAIMFHYGGPSSQQVVDNSSSRPTRDLWHVRQAQRGYVVVIVDNLASTFFGKQGAERLHLRFGELELESQLAAVDYLKSLPYVDGERIGLWGWSGGGANTLYSVFRSPGTWRAAVAGAPVTDWRLYDTVWTERYLGHPADNPDGYRDSSPLTWADGLADPLLVVHGTADDNVHPNNTLVLSQALIEAGIPFEQAIYPRQKHAFGTTSSRHFYERMEAFFDRWLGTGTD